MDEHRIATETRRWIVEFVIGLNLCPFARSVYESERIRYAVTDARSESELLVVLRDELATLVQSDPARLETTLVIHPLVLQDFLAYNDFLDDTDRLLESMGLSGVVQIASFHPLYQFADVAADSVSNYTNRSPYPMLHLLREESISRLSAAEAELLAIPERNIKTLETIGLCQIRRMLAKIQNADAATDPPSTPL